MCTDERCRHPYTCACKEQCGGKELVRATCCNWNVPADEIVFTETVGGETFTLCADCQDDDIDLADVIAEVASIKLEGE